MDRRRSGAPGVTASGDSVLMNGTGLVGTTDLNTATHCRSVFNVTEPSVQSASPAHRSNSDPAAELAVRVTSCPSSKGAEQPITQLIPEGELVTVPPPVPAVATVRITGLPDCVSGTSCPATAMAPALEDVPGFAVTMKARLALPVPAAGPPKEIQESLANAVQAQSSGVVVTVNNPSPPAESNALREVLVETVQAAPAWLMLNNCPATATWPARA